MGREKEAEGETSVFFLPYFHCSTVGPYMKIRTDEKDTKVSRIGASHIEWIEEVVWRNPGAEGLIV